MAKAPRLKVFKAQIGFFETVVAAPSRPKALAAWGTHQDLFTQGEAVELDRAAPEARAALEHPGEVLTRPVGAKGPFKQGSEGAPDIPAPKGKARTPRPDRSALDTAEAALKRLDQKTAETLAGLEDERRSLDRRIEAARTELSERRAAAEEAVERARKAYVSAGGQGSTSKSARSMR